MIKPIINAEYKVHACGQRFDPNDYYNVAITEASFKPTPKWWSHKCNSYHNQDEIFNACDKYKSLNKQRVYSNDFSKF